MSTTENYISLSACVILVVLIVAISYGKGSSYINWAYNIGDQPWYRLLFLLLVMLACQYSFPVALLLSLLFMVINSLVPLLTELDETFVFGAPVSDCSNYPKDRVISVGTPFYPIN